MTLKKYDSVWITATMRRKCATTLGISISEATPEQIYRLLALTVRDQIMEIWTDSDSYKKHAHARKVYYLSVEFLIGRLLSNNILNLQSNSEYAKALSELGVRFEDVEQYEPEPGLGNGGLGRLAACFLDSLSSLSLPAVGSSIRYEYGLFRQKIVDCEQVEMTDNWLEAGNIWEIPRPEDECEVHFYGKVIEDWSTGQLRSRHVDYSTVIAFPYDVPVVGSEGGIINRLRLWSAKAPKRTDMKYFNQGEYTRMENERELAEIISKVLYPEDRHAQGKELRLRQHYFLASATIQNIVKSHIAVHGSNLRRLYDYAAVQINDTHPALAMPELMRILIDDYNMTWDHAEIIVKRTFSYTNHTVLSEALERWGEEVFKATLPRIYSILCEMNERLCKRLWESYPSQWEKIASMAILAYGQVHMANLCVGYSNMVNGVSQLHAQILMRDTFHNYYMIEPEKFIAITNGITHRRWLMDANPQLTCLVSEAIGESWKSNPERLSDLLRHADDNAFLDAFAQVKRHNKIRLANHIKSLQDICIDPDSIFDVHAKRLHEYKRQLMNILHVISLYNRLQEDSSFQMEPRTFIFSGKAAPGYTRAKQIIRLICETAKMINSDSRVNKSLKVVFLENYNVSNAELLIPAADVSEQISTAGKEASGTGNMKFMMNGALTIGTMDGANIEISQRAGMENIFIFGLKAEEIEQQLRTKAYNPGAVYESNPALRHVLEQLIDGRIGGNPGLFSELYQSLLFGSWGQIADPYFVLADFDSYRDAHKAISRTYRDKYNWNKKALINTAMSGYFSTDRTITEYNERIWRLKKLN